MGSAGVIIPSDALGASLHKDIIIENLENDESPSFLTERPKVLFFDVNETLLDLTEMKIVVGKSLNGNTDLLSLWFTTMLQYSLVTTASGHYEHFDIIGAAALQMVAANNGISIPQHKARAVITEALSALPVHTDVKPALTLLKEKGYKLVSFTNSSNEGVQKQFEFAGLTDYFDAQLSVEDVGKFKPFTDTYSWAARKMNVQPKECMLIAAHGWDVAGALWAGWRAAFVSRPGQQLFPLAPKTEIEESDLNKIAAILVAYK